MIRLGAHSYLFTENWSDESLPILEQVRNLGAEVFEIGVGDDLDISSGPVRRRAEALGLTLTTGPGGHWPLECDLSSENPGNRKKGLEWHKRIVDISAELGAYAYCGATYGHPGVVLRRRPDENEYARASEGLHLLAEYAGKSGVVIALEPMSHFRTHLVNTAEQLVRLISLANHDNLKAVIDTYHMMTEARDMGAAVKTGGERLIGLHVCENDRGCPGGGLVPWDEVFTALHGIGFDGYLMLETYNSSIGDFAFRRGMFHDVCPDPVDFTTRGFAFLKRKWAETEVRGA